MNEDDAMKFCSDEQYGIRKHFAFVSSQLSYTFGFILRSLIIRVRLERRMMYIILLHHKSCLLTL